MSAHLVDVSVERSGSIAIVRFVGEIDMSNAATVRQRVAEAVTPDDDAVILDLSELSFIDSAGLHVVFELSAMLEERRQRLLLCAAPESQVDRSIGIVGLPRTVSVHRGRDEALEAARATTVERKPFPPGDG
ncbi:MAG TPA: STAS domain-containing protein [Actinomycetota bacterium]|nr:STAS domain-containing protein [Actinomycetota bacterium]